jgi:hypothetical protein
VASAELLLRFKELQGYKLLVDIGKVQKLGIYSSMVISIMFLYLLQCNSPEKGANNPAHVKYLIEIGAIDVATRFSECSHNEARSPALKVLHALLGSTKKLSKKTELDPLAIAKQTLRKLEEDQEFTAKSLGLGNLLSLLDSPVIKEFLYEELFTTTPKHWELILTCSKEEVEVSDETYLRT